MLQTNSSPGNLPIGKCRQPEASDPSSISSRPAPGGTGLHLIFLQHRMACSLPDHSQHTAYLVALDTSFAYREYQVPSTPAGVIIGRDAALCTVIASGATISRRHARLSLTPEGHGVLDDLGSTNGTYVNGARISAGLQLDDGDVIGLGTSSGHLRFQYSSSANASMHLLPAQEQWTVGRASGCDISLPFEPAVSARHAILRQCEGKLDLSDNHSLNGT